jgi:hypothetical protein
VSRVSVFERNKIPVEITYVNTSTDPFNDGLLLFDS